MEDIVKVIGKRIKQLRIEKGYSKTQFAKLSGVHIAWISRVEQGKRETGKSISPSITILQKIAIALGVPIETLLKESIVKKYTFPSDKTIVEELKELLKTQAPENKALFIQVARKILRK
ncbi:MAG: helix-turn-helix transcriptional regulator [Candidatus Firestonebacteria bacterium]